MRILVLNSGSSSLKCRLSAALSPSAPTSAPAFETLLECRADGVRGRVTLTIRRAKGTTDRLTRTVADHAGLVRWMLELLDSRRPDAVGHRIVHGGARFLAPVRIDERIEREIEELEELAPIHNPAGLAVVKAMRAHFGPAVPMVAVFDTAFHQTIPPHAASYAIPYDLAEKYGIRRYGFHGIAHASMVAAYAQAARKRVEGSRVITLHLGQGCSASAILDGRSIDTSMGFTPLEGLVMGTRSGDLDPAVIPYLSRRTSMPTDQVERMLNERSGLLGLSGKSGDMRVLLEEVNRDRRVKTAIDVFCYRARKYVGAYVAALGGADSLVFGGGIGEHAPEIRARICENMEWCGIVLDRERNEAVVGLPAGTAVPINADRSTVSVYVAGVDEETWIARDTWMCLNMKEGASS